MKKCEHNWESFNENDQQYYHSSYVPDLIVIKSKCTKCGKEAEEFYKFNNRVELTK